MRSGNCSTERCIVNVAKSHNLLKTCAFMCVCPFIWYDLKIQSTGIKSIVPNKGKRRSVTDSTYLITYLYSHENGFHCNFCSFYSMYSCLNEKEREREMRREWETQAKTKSTKILLIIISTNFSSDAMRSAPSFIIIIMWSSQITKKVHTSPATKRNYILRYSLEIDERLTATQLCLSDCNLIISITALAFKSILWMYSSL